MEQGYRVALANACADFAQADPVALAAVCAGSFLRDESAIVIRYLNNQYLIAWPVGTVTVRATGDEAPPATGVLLLNYVLHANGMRTVGRLLPFREIPSAAPYEPSFAKRAVNPLVRTFDGRPDAFAAAAVQLEGTPAAVGDIGFTVPVLPLLPVTYGIWHSDEEFPASGAILFDASAREMLSIECLVVAASNGVYAMMGIAGRR